MAALYAFCREVDDIADNESVAIEIAVGVSRIGARRSTRRATGNAIAAGGSGVQPVIARYGLRRDLFDELLRE